MTTKILNSEEFGETEADRQKLLNEGGLDIYTTMDVNANNAAMQAANDTIPASDSSGLEVMIRGHQARHRRSARFRHQSVRMTPPTRRPATRPRPR